jgi:hypothetical protein
MALDPWGTMGEHFGSYDAEEGYSSNGIPEIALLNGINYQRVGAESFYGNPSIYDPTYGYLFPLEQYNSLTANAAEASSAWGPLEYTILSLFAAGGGALAAGYGAAGAGAAGGTTTAGTAGGSIYGGTSVGGLIGAETAAGSLAAGGTGVSGALGSAALPASYEAAGLAGAGAGAGFGESAFGFQPGDASFTYPGFTTDPSIAALGGGGGGGFGFSDLASLYKSAQPYLSMGSGIKALIDAQQQKKRAQQLGMRADPFGTSGGRAQADAQLQALMRDPSQVAAGDPAYKLRLQAAARANAPMGTDSGAFATGAANASTNWYNERLAQLGGLAGAGVNPGTGVALELQGLASSSDLLSKGLASIGFGAADIANGGNNASVQLMLQQLLKQRTQGANA